MGGSETERGRGGIVGTVYGEGEDEVGEKEVEKSEIL